MSEEVMGKVRGKSFTFTVTKEAAGLISSAKYFVRRDDGRRFGPFDGLAEAFRRAHEEAGPGAFEA